MAMDWKGGRMERPRAVIYFGVDQQFRGKVLAGGGHAVVNCTSFSQLRSALLSHLEVDAILIGDDDDSKLNEAINFFRSETNAPVVLFEQYFCHDETLPFDLVIPAFTAPHDWLTAIQELIERNRALKAMSARKEVD